MILEGDDTAVAIILMIATSLIGLFGVSAGLNGHLFKKIPMVLRLVIIAAGLARMIPGTLTDVGGLVVIALVVGFLFITGRKKKDATAA